LRTGNTKNELKTPLNENQRNHISLHEANGNLREKHLHHHKANQTLILQQTERNIKQYIAMARGHANLAE